MNKFDGDFYTKHLSRENERELARRIVDLCKSVLNAHKIQISNFLDPRGVEIAKTILNRFEDLKYYTFGVFENAERQVIVIYPYYLVDDIDCDLSLISIVGNFKFFKASHRDVLGSLLNIGIEREKIGDIVIANDEIQFTIKNEILEFVIANFNRIAKLSVDCKKIEFDKKLYIVDETERKDLNISSLRLDCLVAAMANINRKKAADLISSEKVKLNWAVVTKNSTEIQEGDQISIRGFGRFKIEAFEGQTRKDRFRIRSVKYL